MSQEELSGLVIDFETMNRVQKIMNLWSIGINTPSTMNEFVELQQQNPSLVSILTAQSQLQKAFANPLHDPS